MENYTKEKLMEISTDLIKGTYGVSVGNYILISKKLNRDNNTIEVKVLLNFEPDEDERLLNTDDAGEILDFCNQLAEVRILDYELRYKLKKSVPQMLLILNIGVERNTDDLFED